MKDYFHKLFVSQKFLASLPDPGEPPDVPGGDTGGGGPGAPVPPPTAVPGLLAYAVPRYTCNCVVNEEMPVITFINDVLNPSFRGYQTQGWNGKIRIHNKKPVTWALSTAAASSGASSISVDDIRNWVTDRSGLLLIDPYTTESEIRICTGATYSTAQNSVTLTASANMTVVGFSGADGASTPATATVTVDSTASGSPSNVTLDGTVIGFTAGSGDTVDGLATLIATTINAHPYIQRRFVATYAAAVVTIKGKFGSLVVDTPLELAHAAPLANPMSAPTAAAAAGTTTSQAGVYRLAYAYTNARGTTYRSPSVGVTLTAGQQIDVTGIAPPAGATAVNWFVSPTAGSNYLRRVATRTDGTNFSITVFPLLDETLPPEINRTGAEVMRVRMAFTDRELARTNLSRSNVLRATYEWLLGNQRKSVNRVDLKIRDASDDWRLLELRFADRRNIEKVKKTEKEEINGQAINSRFQGLRIGMAALGEYRDAAFFSKWGAIREALLLEEGDVVAVTDGSAGYVNLPVMIQELNINPKKAGLPEISFTGQKFSNFLYDDSIADRVVPTVTEFA